MIDEAEFIRLCNEELKNDPAYVQGMKIVGVPLGNRKVSVLTGCLWKAPSVSESIAARAVARVKKLHAYQTHLCGQPDTGEQAPPS